jgi:hypothetical protein
VILERVSHIKQAEAKGKKGVRACGRLPEGKMKVERKKEHNAFVCVRNTTQHNFASERRIHDPSRHKHVCACL